MLLQVGGALYHLWIDKLSKPIDVNFRVVQPGAVADVGCGSKRVHESAKMFRVLRHSSLANTEIKEFGVRVLPFQ